MTDMISGIFTAAITNALKEGLTHLMENPQALDEFGKFLFASHHHNAVDVAQDALDAYDVGHLTREQALEIVTICLKKQNPTVDVRAKRVELEKLFS